MSTSKKSPGYTIGAIIGLVVAGLLVLFGVLWIIASTSQEGDPAWFGQGMVMVIIGLVIVGVAVLVLVKMRPQAPQEIVQRIDLSGDVGMASLKCKNCGAELAKDSIAIKEGAIFVSCPYCSSTYQMVEEPKW